MRVPDMPYTTSPAHTTRRYSWRPYALKLTGGGAKPPPVRCGLSVQSPFRCAESSAPAVVKRLMVADDPRWLLSLSAWVSHDRAARRYRYEELRSFSRVRFKAEFDTVSAPQPSGIQRNR